MGKGSRCRRCEEHVKRYCIEVVEVELRAGRISISDQRQSTTPRARNGANFQVHGAFMVICTYGSTMAGFDSCFLTDSAISIIRYLYLTVRDPCTFSWQPQSKKIQDAVLNQRVNHFWGTALHSCPYFAQSTSRTEEVEPHTMCSARHTSGNDRTALAECLRCAYKGFVQETTASRDSIVSVAQFWNHPIPCCIAAGEWFLPQKEADMHFDVGASLHGPNGVHAITRDRSPEFTEAIRVLFYLIFENLSELEQLSLHLSRQ